MPEDIPPSWKSLASSRLSSFKGYIAQKDFKHVPMRLHDGGESGQQTWKKWAVQKIQIRRNVSYDSVNSGTEKISLFPGWAARRHRIGSLDAFDIDVFISGFAFSQRSQEQASRSQRAFLRLAKGFASLPKLAVDAADVPNSGPLTPLAAGKLTPSTEELLASIQLPPRPSEITEDYEIQALEKEFQRANTAGSGDSESPTSSSASSVDLNFEAPPPITLKPNNVSPLMSSDIIKRLHANLETRLQPFWSTALSSRTIRVHIFTSPRVNAQQNGAVEKGNTRLGPVASLDVMTAPDGSFQARYKLKWEDICQNPSTLFIAFGDSSQEHDLLVVCEMLPKPPSPLYPTSSSRPPSPLGYGSRTTDSISFGCSEGEVKPSTAASTIIPITHSPTRVISDIDDTIKLSNILSGARSVFHSVFVKELKDTVIPGMGDWYTGMWRKGVRFHYVSNGPFELLPVINEFFHVSNLPPGSIKLKSYAGRSIFNGLLSAPATRKRAGVLDILDSFPESQFILIGDTGEQDLELYAQFAKERPNQILGVFVRDAEDSIEVIPDPTGQISIDPCACGQSTPLSSMRPPQRSFSDLLKTPRTSGSRTPTAVERPPETGYFASSPLNDEPEPMLPPMAPFASTYTPTSVSSPATSSAPSSTYARMSDADKKRYELQLRVCKARTQIPQHIPLRIFRNPAECVEVDGILERVRGIGT